MTTTNTMDTWNDLLTSVEENAGIQKIPMAQLRELEGRQRVGKHVLSAIEDKLATLGLGHLPQELPNRQQQNVLLYRFGTPVSEVIEAVRKGLNEPVNDSAYQYLHRLNSIPDPTQVVAKEEFGAQIEKTARSVLALLSQVRPSEESEPTRAKKAKPTRGKARTGEEPALSELVKELVPVEASMFSNS